LRQQGDTQLDILPQHYSASQPRWTWNLHCRGNLKSRIVCRFPCVI